MTPLQFRAVEQALGMQHQAFADALGLHINSVKRMATGTQTITPMTRNLAVALLLIQSNSLEQKYKSSLDKYHDDTL
jgi:plasmid maintenance system antidote protein VapI